MLDPEFKYERRIGVSNETTRHFCEMATNEVVSNLYSRGEKNLCWWPSNQTKQRSSVTQSDCSCCSSFSCTSGYKKESSRVVVIIIIRNKTYKSKKRRVREKFVLDSEKEVNFCVCLFDVCRISDVFLIFVYLEKKKLRPKKALLFVFLIVILGSTSPKAPAGFAGIAIGLALTLIHLVSIPVTNTSVNPAR